MPSISELMRANLFDVFNERDADRRAAAIAATYSADAVFHDPEGTANGHAEIDAAAAKVLDGAPEFVFTAAGPPLESNDLGYLAWHFGPEDGEPVVSGMDIALTKDGLIATLYTLVTAS
jgi:SnoaL-like domain